MTMATNGKQIEELPAEEQKREIRLRYAGSIRVLVWSELRTSAARLCAAFPLMNEGDFVRLAREAFADVVGKIHAEARDACHEILTSDAEVMCHTCDAMTVKQNRVRVVVCVRCSLEGRTPGSNG